jgi:hypothetical protein
MRKIIKRLLKPYIDKYRWKNPRNSIGEQRGVVRNGKYVCWEAIGPVREVWKRLGPEIKDYVENSCKYGPALSIEIYMIGRTEDTAAPKILICSTDPVTRKDVRRAIIGSGIMDNYPPIGLGDTTNLPDLLAQEDIETTFSLNSNLGDETVVLSSPLDNVFGRRLFIPRRDGGSLRPATAGPILHILDKVYQLTVGHAFLEVNDVALFETRSSNLDDCDFDGQSDSENEDSSASLETRNEDNSIVKENLFGNNCDPNGNAICINLKDASSSGPGLSSSASASQSLLPSDVDLSARSVSASSNQSQTTQRAIIRKLDRIGKLALASETGTKQSLDYALVELEGVYRYGSNEIACGPNGSQRWLRIIQAAKIGLEDVNIVTMTASSGFMSGKLCATASYLRLPNQRTLQELYSIRLDGKLTDGDCGSGVVDPHAGYFYGHIVAGNTGTGLAYIVPAIQVFEDIFDRLGTDVTLVPPVEPTPSKSFSKDHPDLEPYRLVEFASKEYFSQVMQPTLSNEDEKNTKILAPTTHIPGASFSLPIRSQMPSKQYERTNNRFPGRAQQQNSLRQTELLDPINSIRSKISTPQSKAPASNARGNGNGKERDDVTISLTFEQRFLALPSDLQVQVIASLCISDILNLRLASRNWHNLISLNEKPISRGFLEYNAIPFFAMSLYPLPNPSAINLHYICGMGHRLFVASKLSALMTEWITKDIFLRNAETELLEFLPQQSRMSRRLVPLLFTIFHFFETYRHLHLKHLLEHGQGLPHEAFMNNSVETEIMNIYDNETLLQVHQIFPLFVSSLCRKLRPPSYLGRIERSIRGYLREPPPDHVQVAILSIGGLREVVRFLEIEDYDARITAVDNWYASVSREPINSGSKSRRWPLGLARRQLRLASWSAAEASTDNRVPDTASVSLCSGLKGGPDDWTRSRHGESLLFNSSLAAGPPMHPLSAEHALLLLSDLPVLQQIWLLTGEALLLKRGVVERRQDIKRNAQVMLELIREGITEVDELFYRRAEHGSILEGELLA